MKASDPARKSIQAREPEIEEAITAALPAVLADADTMVVHFIDVGQGDATLVEFSCGAVLIDTGGENTNEVNGPERLHAYLQQFFQRRADLGWTLNAVVLSHPHVDHTGGVPMLLEMEPALTIKNVIDNGASGSGVGLTEQTELQQYAHDNAMGYQSVAAEDITSVSGATSRVIDPINCQSSGGIDPKLSVLWGDFDNGTQWSQNPNNDSVVFRVQFGSAVFLFTGDLQEQAIKMMLESYEADLSVFDADVLKVGHHGSHNATTAPLLAAVTPKIAVAQSGDSTLSRAQFSAYNHGHPNLKAIRLLTDLDNGVSMSRPAKTVRVGVSGRDPFRGTPPRFTTLSMDRAVYDNGWDGNIAISAHSDGTLSVQYEY